MNIYDIAKEAGVSIATVSRVLNQKGAVSASTRAKVEAVLAEHHYLPSAIARGMVSKSMRTVAVITVDIREPHYARTAYFIEQAFSQRGYEVILCNTGIDGENTVKYLQALINKQVDGVVLVGSIFNRIGKKPEVQVLLRNVPVVLANGRLELENSYSVEVDDVGGVEAVVEHLLSHGRTNLVYVKDVDTDSAAAKMTGFVKGLQAHGLFTEERVVYTEYGLEGGIAAVEQLLHRGIAFDGIVCGQDMTAAGVVQGLQAAGLRVPEDVAVTGYNDSVYGRICQPQLTTVDNQPEAVAMHCVELLIALINGEDHPGTVMVQPQLHIGQST